MLTRCAVVHYCFLNPDPNLKIDLATAKLTSRPFTLESRRFTTLLNLIMTFRFPDPHYNDSGLLCKISLL